MLICCACGTVLDTRHTYSDSDSSLLCIRDKDIRHKTDRLYTLVVTTVHVVCLVSNYA